MKRRKTFEISTLIDRANHLFLHSDETQASARLSVQLFVETILMDTGNYKGFGYLHNEFPTIKDRPDLHPSIDNPISRAGITVDETRVFFYK